MFSTVNVIVVLNSPGKPAAFVAAVAALATPNTGVSVNVTGVGLVSSGVPSLSVEPSVASSVVSASGSIPSVELSVVDAVGFAGSKPGAATSSGLEPCATTVLLYTPNVAPGVTTTVKLIVPLAPTARPFPAATVKSFVFGAVPVKFAKSTVKSALANVPAFKFHELAAAKVVAKSSVTCT